MELTVLERIDGIDSLFGVIAARSRKWLE